MSPPPTPAERLAVILRHLDLYVAQAGETVAVREMRKHVCWYVRGLPGCSPFRVRVQGIKTEADLRAALEDYLGARLGVPEVPIP